MVQTSTTQITDNIAGGFPDGILAGQAIKSGPNSGDTVLIQAYDVDNAVYRTFCTITSGATPSLALSAPVGGALSIDGATITGGSSSVSSQTVTGAFSALGGSVFNEDSADVDFRVESNNNANAIFVDAGTDRVGIFTAAPSVPFEVTGDTKITGNFTITGDITLSGGDLDLGTSGAAGSLDIFPTTALKGKLRFVAADNTNDDAVTITNAAFGQASTLTIPDVGSATGAFVMDKGTSTISGAKTFSSAVTINPTTNQLILGVTNTVTINSVAPSASLIYSIQDFGSAADFVLANAINYKIDGVAMSSVKWVDVAVTAAILDGGGNVPVIAGVAGDQYKIRAIRLVGGGTNFGAGGDRNISLTDGTTTWTTIDNADIESAPTATLEWGDAKVPFLTGTSNTSSVAGQAIRFQYSGGTTDHTTGSITFSVAIEKIA